MIKYCTTNDITNLFNFESPDCCFNIKYLEYARNCSLWPLLSCQLLQLLYRLIVQLFNGNLILKSFLNFHELLQNENMSKLCDLYKRKLMTWNSFCWKNWYAWQLIQGYYDRLFLLYIMPIGLKFQKYIFVYEADLIIK